MSYERQTSLEDVRIGPISHPGGNAVKVIFLDIDGVLNTRKTVERWQGCIGIDQVLANRFARLQQATAASVVLSSTWRVSRDWRATMRKNGVVGIIDRTPDLRDRTRGEEIQAWLNAHPEVQLYAILDDVRDMLPHQPLFRTSFFRGGLTEEIAQRVQLHFARRVADQS
jgi:hypothetical protein